LKSRSQSPVFHLRAASGSQYRPLLSMPPLFLKSVMRFFGSLQGVFLIFLCLVQGLARTGRSLCGVSKLAPYLGELLIGCLHCLLGLIASALFFGQSGGGSFGILLRHLAGPLLSGELVVQSLQISGCLIACIGQKLGLLLRVGSE